MDESTATWHSPDASDDRVDERPALVLVYCAAEPLRAGESALLSDGEWILGRHGTLEWRQHRPGHSRRTGALGDKHLSRQQLKITVDGDTVTVENAGRLPLRLNNHPVASCPVVPGDVLQVGERLLLLCTSRPVELPGEVPRRHRFGEADPSGLVGESVAAWDLRDRVGFVARRHQHVLVLGESGTGKELVARALHRQSERHDKPLVSRNAATIPESLADAELFGNLSGYPNPGMPARPGLVGEADSGILFLDEFGELPLEQQARLLRVMDAGEYTRLGEAKPRTSDLRVVAATNRDPGELKHDVLARFPIRVQLPPLSSRREDIPLLAHHLLAGIARDDDEIARRYFPGGDPMAPPRLSIELMRALLVHRYSTHVRELSALLWQSITASTGDVLDVPEGGFVEVAPAPAAKKTAAPKVSEGPVDPASLDPETIQEALDRHNGRQEPVWRELGLSSRHVLARLVKKYDLNVRGRGG